MLSMPVLQYVICLDGAFGCASCLTSIVRVAGTSGDSALKLFLLSQEVKANAMIELRAAMKHRNSGATSGRSAAVSSASPSTQRGNRSVFVYV